MHTLLENLEEAPLSALTAHPRNPRRGRVDLIAQSLRENSQYSPLVVQRSTGHVLKGNHTLAAARELGWTTLSVVYIDVDETRALKILLSDNHTSDLSAYDDDALLGLLQSLQDDLPGTTYDLDEMDRLRTALDEQFDVTPWDDADAPAAPPAPKAAPAAERSEAEPDSLAALTVAMTYERRQEAMEMIGRLRHLWDSQMSDADVLYEALRRASSVNWDGR